MRIVSLGDVLARSPDNGLRRVTYKEAARGAGRGFVAGSDESGLYMVDTPHALLAGRTGTGKTVSCLMPTLLVNSMPRPGEALSQPNMVVVDCKNTIRSNLAAPLKANGYKLAVVDLGVDGDSPDSWNPLAGACKAFASGDAAGAERALSNLRAPFVEQIASEKDRYWETNAWNAVSGVALALISAHAGRKKPPTLREVFETVHDTTRLKALASLLEDKGKEIPPGLRGAIDLSGVNGTWRCVVSTIDGFLSFYATEQARSCAEKSTVDFGDLFASRPLAIILQCPDTSSPSLQFAGIFMSCLYREYVSEFERRGCEEKGGARGLLLAVDEFARYRFSEMPSIMACGRSRGVRALLAIQSFSQFMEGGAWRESEARVMCEQAGASILMSNTSPEIARLASFSSGGVVDEKALCTLPPGAAYVTAAGSMPSKTGFLSFGGS